MNMIEAIIELGCTLADAAEAAWKAMDLDARMEEWWYVVRHPEQMDGPPPNRVLEAREVYLLNERQERALALGEKYGRIRNALVWGCFPLKSPETIRLDLRGLVDLGLLERHGLNKGTYYVPVQKER